MEVVPIAGLVIWGRASVDVKHVTGFAELQLKDGFGLKGTGDNVSAGMVIQSGYLHIRADLTSSNHPCFTGLQLKSRQQSKVIVTSADHL